MDWLSWVITVLVGSLLIGWGLYLKGMHRLPLAKRPSIMHLNRLGEPMGRDEVLDYHIMAGVDSDD